MMMVAEMAVKLALTMVHMMAVMMVDLMAEVTDE